MSSEWSRFQAAVDFLKRLEAEGITPADIDSMTSGTAQRHLSGLVGALRGTHEIRPVGHLVNLSATPELPCRGVVMEVHTGEGVVRLEKRGNDLYMDGERLVLYRSKKQMGKKLVTGYELRKELDKRGGKNLNACVLDYLQAHPELWPNSWKKQNAKGNGPYVFFWGTIFYHPTLDRWSVRVGYWINGRVASSYRCVDADWNVSDPAASSAS